MSDLVSFFPRLSTSVFRVTSQATPGYNCIAWAAGDTRRWWWPDSHGLYYWPPAVPREATIAAFIQAYALLGFEACESPDFEPGFEKVALFAKAGEPTHAARQLGPNLWTSKCGQLEDIEHELHGFHGSDYGEPVRFLRRRSVE